MKKIVAVCLLLSLFITGFCFFEYELPNSQWLKSLSDLKTAGITDKELIDRIRWDILGVQTTWPPLLTAALCQNALIVILLAKTASCGEKNVARSTSQHDSVA